MRLLHKRGMLIQEHTLAELRRLFAAQGFEGDRIIRAACRGSLAAQARLENLCGGEIEEVRPTHAPHQPELRMTMPISGHMWNGGNLILDQDLPDVIRTALPGRPVADLIDCPTTGHLTIDTVNERPQGKQGIVVGTRPGHVDGSDLWTPSLRDIPMHASFARDAIRGYVFAPGFHGLGNSMTGLMLLVMTSMPIALGSVVAISRFPGIKYPLLIFLCVLAVLLLACPRDNWRSHVRRHLRKRAR